jgi:hypothetical protein
MGEAAAHDPLPCPETSVLDFLETLERGVEKELYIILFSRSDVASLFMCVVN